MKKNRIEFLIVVLTLCVVMLSIVTHATLAAAGSSSSSPDLSGTAALSISLVNQDPDPANAGDLVEVRLGVANIGGKTANNVIVEITPEYPLELVPGEEATQKLGTINEYQQDENLKIVKYNLKVDKDAIAGSYEFKVTAYEEGSSTKTQKSLIIDVQNTESAEVIYIDKSTLVPGKQDTLNFTINNVGNAPLRDLTFSWVNSDKIILPVGSDNTKYIKYIDVGQSTDLQFQVMADSNADAGLYKLDLLLTYEDPITNTKKEISTIAGVYVGGSTDFDVAFSETSSGQTSFSIANIGSNPALSVSVIIPQQDGWRVTGSNSMIIGNLNKGDYTVASFNLQSSQTMPRFNTGQNTSQNGVQRNQQMNTSQQGSGVSMRAQSNVKVQIAYTDTMGTRQIVEKEVAMNLQSLNGNSTSLSAGTSSFRGRSQPSFFSTYKWYIAAVIALLIIGIIYTKYRKEKIRNPNFKIKDFFKKKKK